MNFEPVQPKNQKQIKAKTKKDKKIYLKQSQLFGIDLISSNKKQFDQFLIAKKLEYEQKKRNKLRTGEGLGIAVFFK